PSMVKQRKIAEIIQAKPEQRRRVLEDAAGVAGLHARRNEAELRLKAAETNLTRVEDVIGQLSGQIDGLKKQARQAIRFREVAAKVRKAEATLFHLRWLEANADVAEAGHTHDITGRELAARTHRNRLARLNQEIASVQADEEKLAQETGNLGDLDALAAAMETAQETLAVSEAAAQSSETGHVAARQKLEASRGPLTE